MNKCACMGIGQPFPPNDRGKSIRRMAIAIGRCHDMKAPAARPQHCRLRSFAQLDGALFDWDCQELDGADNPAGLSPRHRSLSSPCFLTVANDGVGEAESHSDKTMPRVEIVAGSRARGVQSLIALAAAAIASRTRLVPAPNGLSGALLLNDGRSGEHVAVIKPVGEHPSSSPSRGGGGGYTNNAGLREVAAFLLDHGGFASVAPTALIKIYRHAATPTVASIQQFVPHDYDAGELGPSRFSVASVHRVGILDVRLLNIDRHAGNILIKKPATNCTDSNNDTTSTPLELVPIDHGLCLPEQLEDPYFEWLHWPQSSLPFSDAELEYISSLDPSKDAELLRAELPSLKEPAIRILILCTTFLKLAAVAGLCLADIGDMMTREFSALEEGFSALEALCKCAEDSIHSSVLFPPSSLSDDDDEENTHLGMNSEGVAGGLHHLLLQSASRDDKAGVSIPKSVSFSVAEGNATGGGRSRISFKGLSGDEWSEFLESFEQLLPKAFEARKCTGGLKRRLGTSCKF